MLCTTDYFYHNGSKIVPTCSFDSNFHLIYFIGYGIVMSILVIIGTFGNLLAIIVLLSPRIWSCLNYYLITLALWDSTLLISSFTQWSLWSLYFHNAIPLIGNHVGVLKLSYFFGNATLTGCVWIILALTVERYLAIVWPLSHRGMDNAKRAKFVLITVSHLALICNLSRIFEINIISNRYLTKGDNNSYEPVLSLSGSGLRENWNYFVFYRIGFNLVFIYAGPCCVLAMLTIQMVSTIAKARRTRMCLTMENLVERAKQVKHQGLKTDSAKEDRNTNVVLVSVLAKFLLCYLLPTVIDILEVCLSPATYHDSKIIEALIICSNLLVVFNSSTNSVLYFMLSRRFRNELWRMVTKTNSVNTAISAKTSCTTLGSYGAISNPKGGRSVSYPSQKQRSSSNLGRNGLRHMSWQDRCLNQPSGQDNVDSAIRAATMRYVVFVEYCSQNTSIGVSTPV